MGKLKIHSPIYCKSDYWDNWQNLRHTLNRIYLLSMLYVQRLHISLYNDDNGMCNVQMHGIYLLSMLYVQRLHISLYNDDNGMCNVQMHGHLRP